MCQNRRQLFNVSFRDTGKVGLALAGGCWAAPEVLHRSPGWPEEEEEEEIPPVFPYGGIITCLISSMAS